MSKKQKVIYYSDELCDEFSTARITPKRIDKSYVYCHDSRVKKFTRFFWYRLVFTPIAYLYAKIKFRHKVYGAERLRGYRHTGYFLYGNHTQQTADAFIPNLLDVKKESYFIVHPNNVSMPLLGRITPSLGALPLPSGLAAYKNFSNAVKRRAGEGCSIVIYPEAHIWPYYTGIRPFPDDSFHFPVSLDLPTFCFTNTYQKGRTGRTVIVTYVDGPFFPKASLPPRQRRAELRDRVYEQMKNRAARSCVTAIKYVKKDSPEESAERKENKE